MKNMVRASAAILASIFSLAAFSAEKPVPVGWEPWVPQAKVGDFVVRKSMDRLTRSEVKEVTKNYVAVEETSGGSRVLKHYSLKKIEPTSVVGSEVDMKESAKNECKIGGKTVTCKTFSGSMVVSDAHGGKQVTATKIAKYEKVVSDAVPFGGLVKEALAEDDGIDIKPNGGRQVNTSDKMMVLSELVDFGNVLEDKATATKK